MWWDDLLKFKPSIRTGKKGDLSDWTWNGCWCQNGLVWVFQKLLIYWDFHAQPSLGFTENGPKKRNFPVSCNCGGRKCLVDVRGQRRIGRLVRDDRKATATQIHHSLQTNVCRIPSLNTQHLEPWSRWAPAAEDHTGVLLLSTKNRKRRYNSHRLHQNWTIEDWKNVAWSDESRFLLRHSDGRIRIRRKEHESMDPSCLVSMVQAGGGVNGVGNIFLAHFGPISTNWASFKRHSLP